MFVSSGELVRLYWKKVYREQPAAVVSSCYDTTASLHRSLYLDTLTNLHDASCTTDLREIDDIRHYFCRKTGLELFPSHVRHISVEPYQVPATDKLSCKAHIEINQPLTVWPTDSSLTLSRLQRDELNFPEDRLLHWWKRYLSFVLHPPISNQYTLKGSLGQIPCGDVSISILNPEDTDDLIVRPYTKEEKRLFLTAVLMTNSVTNAMAQAKAANAPSCDLGYNKDVAEAWQAVIKHPAKP